LEWNGKKNMTKEWIISPSDPILITGARGFIGSSVVQAFLNLGFAEVRAVVRAVPEPSTSGATVPGDNRRLPIFMEGNLLSPEDCARVVKGAKVIVHLAAGADKSFSGSYYNSVIVARNLLAAAGAEGGVARFINVSSFAVYSNWSIPRGGMLDERCAVESEPYLRHEPYCYAKTKQDEIVQEMSRVHAIPVVTVRPGAVFGPRSRQYLTPRIGIDTFGIFLHLGGQNRIPLTYVDNCAEAIALAALSKGVDGEVFNIVDDDLPLSRDFLRDFKRYARRFYSISVPYPMFYLFCHLWEWYSVWSKGQLAPVFNRRRCAAYWKGNNYSNEKAKRMLGWSPRVPFAEAARRHFAYFKTAAVAGK
jgi:nucleoside-diphosphate-sugar epimerase